MSESHKHTPQSFGADTLVNAMVSVLVPIITALVLDQIRPMLAPVPHQPATPPAETK